MSPKLSDLPKVLKELEREAERIKKESGAINKIEEFHDKIKDGLDGGKNIKYFYDLFEDEFYIRETGSLLAILKDIKENEDKYREEIVEKAKFVLGEVIFICMPLSEVANRFLEEGYWDRNDFLEKSSYWENQLQSVIKSVRAEVGDFNTWEEIPNSKKPLLYLPGESSKFEDKKENMIRGLRTLREIIYKF